MNKSFLAIAVAASLSSYASFSLAEVSSPSTNSPQADETVVVTANRVEQQLKDVLAPVEVVTRQEIELFRQNHSLRYYDDYRAFRLLAKVVLGKTQSFTFEAVQLKTP
ncbi:hypothetical protein JCM19239_5984 [Vibrio variabilis]|uniref:Uncharacterized protein n=1 Tax=Vibrio variabilis TaxID=990271 RepID=A0ABQ0J8S9_9VIBR|nr:hypothetical protein JCM19239_5984 [Vibrio variabilis]